jgi:ligand-binding sensor domain-containing protein
MNKINFIFILLLNLIFSQNTYADIVKYPTFDITNYPSEVHGGIQATWGITQSKNGKLYFSNTFGVLIFDGMSWKNLKTLGNKAARSIAIDKNDNIIVGTKGDMGVVASDKLNNVIYQSIISKNDSNLLEPNTVYEIHPLGDNKYLYRTASELFIFSNGAMKKIKNPKKFRFGVSHYINGKIYIYVKKQGLFTLSDGNFLSVLGTENFKTKKQTIYGVFEKDNGLVIITRKSGVYFLKSGVLEKINHDNELISQTTIYRAISLSSGGYALATYDGILLLNEKLNVEQHISRDNGLITNNVRSLHEDFEGNLWAGTNDGISKIRLKSGIRYFDKSVSKINSTISRLKFFNNKIYLATETGLSVLKTDIKNKRQFFEPILKDQIKTQVWDLLVYKDKLFVVSNNGLGFVDKHENYEQFLERKKTGSVYKIKESKLFEGKILIGTRKGLGVIDPLKKDKINFLKMEKGKIWDFYEVPVYNDIWTKVKGKGVYRLNFDTKTNLIESNNKVSKYTTDNGLPLGSLYKIVLFEYKGEILFGTENGTYRFDRNSKSFNIDERFSKLPNYKNNKVIRVDKDPSGDYWFVLQNRSKGFRDVNFYTISDKLQFTKLELGKLKHYSRIKLNFYKEKVLLSGTRGIAIFPKKYMVKEPQGRVIINQISVKNKSIYNHAPLKTYQGKKITIPNTYNYSDNNIKFVFSGTDYGNERRNKYRHTLSNFYEQLSFTNDNNITYTNLSPGNYTFTVEGLNSLGKELKPSSFSFEIKPPWWETTYFYVGEILFFILLLLITAFSKTSTRGQKFATAMTFVVIIVFFEFLNMFIDPLLIKLTGGIPVFDLLSKVALGLLLQPVERLASKLLDMFSDFVGKKTIVR